VSPGLVSSVVEIDKDRRVSGDTKVSKQVVGIAVRTN
jgi:hypothetical protein